MPKKSGLLLRLEAQKDAKYQEEFNRKMRFLQQMCIDSAFMAASDVVQMGPGRCEAFGRAMVGYLHEMAVLMKDDVKDDKEIVYTKETVDRRLRKICEDKFDPWEIRYETDRRRQIEN